MIFTIEKLLYVDKHLFFKYRYHMLPMLTNKEKEVLSFIENFISENQIPPTTREIASFFNIAPKNAFKYLKILEEKRYIKREKNISRGIKILKPQLKEKKIPFYSYVAAGSPIDINEIPEDSCVVDSKIFPYQNMFMFKVIGDSMIDAHIEDGDFAIVCPDLEIKDGDIIVVSIYNEITLKRFIKTKNGELILHPENSKYNDIILNEINPDEIKILGKVIGIIRSIK